MAQELTDIDGLGSTSASRLKNAGIVDLEDLANADPSDAEEINKISKSRLKGWIKTAERDAVRVISGQQVVEDHENVTKISTGIEELDDLLDGGWDAGFMVAIGGGTGSGKTQLSFQSLGQAVKKTGKTAVYIETERGRYKGRRIAEMFDSEIQSKVSKVPAYSLDQQEMAYEKLLEEFNPDNLSCVVVDSFTARFRMSENFTGRSDLPDRHTVMSRHLDKLDRLAASCEVPVILTCQVSANPDSYGASQTIYGGTLMHHMVNFVCFMRGRKGALTNLEIRNHPQIGDTELELQIYDGGVRIAK